IPALTPASSGWPALSPAVAGAFSSSLTLASVLLRPGRPGASDPLVHLPGTSGPYRSASTRPTLLTTGAQRQRQVNSHRGLADSALPAGHRAHRHSISAGGRELRHAASVPNPPTHPIPDKPPASPDQQVSGETFQQIRLTGFPANLIMRASE